VRQAPTYPQHIPGLGDRFTNYQRQTCSQDNCLTRTSVTYGMRTPTPLCSSCARKLAVDRRFGAVSR
jgi:hypothetical protein